MLKVSGIIMAAGFSTRMGANKLFLTYQGTTFLERVIRLTRHLDLSERILVLSPENNQKVSFGSELKVVINEQAQLGQSGSVRLGTQAASGDGYLYLTVDQPLLTPELFVPLFKAYSKETIVFPVDRKQTPNSPIFFGSRFRSELLSVRGSAGGRLVRQRHQQAWRKIQVSEPERLLDVDTPVVYQQLVQRSWQKERK